MIKSQNVNVTNAAVPVRIHVFYKGSFILKVTKSDTSRGYIVLVHKRIHVVVVQTLKLRPGILNAYPIILESKYRIVLKVISDLTLIYDKKMLMLIVPDR
jgi:hypothetical protein